MTPAPTTRSPVARVSRPVIVISSASFSPLATSFSNLAAALAPAARCTRLRWRSASASLMACVCVRVGRWERGMCVCVLLEEWEIEGA